jgi:predicted DNA-binding protein with PD1-like motif
MSARVRLLRHPGPVDPVRLESSIEPAGCSVRLQLAEDKSLLDAIVEPLALHDIWSATFTLFGGGLSRVRYVLARPDQTSPRIVSLTDAIEADSVSLVTGSGTLGRGVDGKPFIHCHALFADKGGETFGGHVLTDATVIGAGAVAYVRGFSDVSVEVRYDAEIDVPTLRPRAVRIASPSTLPGAGLT